MKKLGSVALAIVALVGGWFILQQLNANGWKLPGLQLGNGALSTATPPPRGGDTVRIATWNIQVFGESKLSDPAAMEVIVSVLKNFDLVAIQEIRAQSQDILPQLIALLNADGKYQYDYVIGPRLGRTSSKEQYAFVFDMASIEVDRNQIYTIDDTQDDLLHREPLVGWFRARVAPEKQAQAFTFSMVNIHTDPDEVDRELNVLDDVFFAVRDDLRNEDDVILLGDVNVNEKNLGELGKIAGLTWVVANTPTNTRGDAQYDNLFFHSTATPEFTGRGGVLDFMRAFNLKLEEQALKVSDHLPVWAEFSVYEGGQPGALASRPQ